MLIIVKMTTIVGILTFMSRINFVFSLVEFEKKFYNLEARSRFKLESALCAGLLSIWRALIVFASDVFSNL